MAPRVKIPIVKNAMAIILLFTKTILCPYLSKSRSEIFKDLPQQDAALAMGNICLLAQSKGIGQCIYQLNDAWLTSKEIKNRFNINSEDRLQGLVCLGYQNEEINYETATHAGRAIKRKPIEHYIHEWRK